MSEKPISRRQLLRRGTAVGGGVLIGEAVLAGVARQAWALAEGGAVPSAGRCEWTRGIRLSSAFTGITLVFQPVGVILASRAFHFDDSGLIQ